MSATRSALALPILGLLLAAPSPAQQRRPLLGRVVDADGGAVVGAEVHFVFTDPGTPEARADDAPTATTDERGRFRTELFANTRYLAWALGPADEHGARAVTQVVGATAGCLLELRIAGSCVPSKLTIRGAEAWAALGPLQVRVAPAAILTDDPLLPVENGEVTLPPLPFGSCSVDVLLASGQPLLLGRIAVPRDEHRLHLPPPQPLPMRVVDADGQPLADAVIHQRLQGTWFGETLFASTKLPRLVWRELGRTDADGRLTPMIPAAQDPLRKTGWQSLMFRATKKGYAGSISGVTDEPYCDAVQVSRQDLDALRFTLQEQPPLHGQLVAGDHRLGGVAVTVVGEVNIRGLQANTWNVESLVLHGATAADGSITLSPITGLSEPRIRIAGAALHELVPEPLRRTVPFAPIALPRKPAELDAALRIPLADLGAVQLQLLDGSGGPAAGVDVLLLPCGQAAPPCDGWTSTMSTDGAGRVAMLLPKGEWAVFARNEREMVYQRLQVEDAGLHSLQLAPMQAMRGRVVDTEDRPVAGALLTLTGASFRTGGGGDEVLETIAESLNWNWIAATTTDADGRFVCCFLPLPNLGYEGKFLLGGRESTPFAIEAGDDEQTLVVK